MWFDAARSSGLVPGQPDALSRDPALAQARRAEQMLGVSVALSALLNQWISPRTLPTRK